MINLPEKFRKRMEAELKDGFADFLSSYDSPPVKGIRVNSLKIAPDKFARISPFSLSPVPWEENGFYVEEEKTGRHPYYFAGLYYPQEPSAMAVAPLLGVRSGDKVLDLCSSPGGKGTRLAEYMKGKGVIVLNEYVSSRAKILSSNVERMGIENAVVTNERCESLSKRFPAYFDRILIDAPCSGEGMFKKNEEEAIGNWSEENVKLCAARQRGILAEGAKMLKGGGTLVYSTCTFSREEDEEQIEDFLKAHQDFSLVREEKLYPHIVKGEGHFIAVLQKKGYETGTVKTFKEKSDKKDEEKFLSFAEKFTSKKFSRLYRVKDTLYSLPEGIFDLKGINVLRAGVRLGEFVKDRFEPSHSFAMCLNRGEIKNFVSVDCRRALKYLSGETLSSGNADGWCVVGVDDYPLGTGKISGGTVKNHYPKGLRITDKNLLKS